jgi:hypothetical protein
MINYVNHAIDRLMIPSNVKAICFCADNDDIINYNFHVDPFIFQQDFSLKPSRRKFFQINSVY